MTMSASTGSSRSAKTRQNVQALWYFLVGSGLAVCDQDEPILSQGKRSWADLADVLVEGVARLQLY